MYEVIYHLLQNDHWETALTGLTTTRVFMDRYVKIESICEEIYIMTPIEMGINEQTGVRTITTVIAAMRPPYELTPYLRSATNTCCDAYMRFWHNNNCGSHGYSQSWRGQPRANRASGAFMDYQPYKWSSLRCDTKVWPNALYYWVCRTKYVLDA